MNKEDFLHWTLEYVQKKYITNSNNSLKPNQDHWGRRGTKEVDPNF